MRYKLSEILDELKNSKGLHEDIIELLTLEDLKKTEDHLKKEQINFLYEILSKKFDRTLED